MDLVLIVESFNDYSTGAEQAVPVLHFLLLCSGKVRCQLVIDLVLHLHFELVLFHIVKNVRPGDGAARLSVARVAAN